MQGRALIVAVCMAGSACADTNMLVNGSFEDPVVSPISKFVSYVTGQTMGSGWVVDFARFDSDILDKNYTGGGADWPGSSDGNQYCYVGDSLGLATISQGVHLLGGTQYSLSFDIATFFSPAVNATLIVDIQQGGASVLGGGAVTFQQLYSNNPGIYATKTLDFTVPAEGDYRLVCTSPEGSGTNVDNFRLVPTPGAAMMLLGGLVGRRRR